MKLDSINPQKFQHYDGRKMDFPKIINTINIAKQSTNMPQKKYSNLKSNENNQDYAIANSKYILKY
jgi:hypothetical protein